MYMENKKINNNEHSYVDLGLPSKTLWATMNVGAFKPSESGLYFQWGDTQGYSKEQIGRSEGKKKFTCTDYKWYLSGSVGEGSINFRKDIAEGAKLDLEDDAAHVNMGGSWHMPTPNQIWELTHNTISSWTTQDGVNGRLFTSTKDSSKSIFIPASGSAWSGSVKDIGRYGIIWSSVLSMVFTDSCQCLILYSEDSYLTNCDRSDGFSVRGVIG